MPHSDVRSFSRLRVSLSALAINALRVIIVYGIGEDGIMAFADECVEELKNLLEMQCRRRDALSWF
jgi:hypothetical protein